MTKKYSLRVTSFNCRKCVYTNGQSAFLHFCSRKTIKIAKIGFKQTCNLHFYSRRKGGFADSQICRNAESHYTISRCIQTAKRPNSVSVKPLQLVYANGQTAFLHFCSQCGRNSLFCFTPKHRLADLHIYRNADV